MIIEHQVCTLEQAKKLKELGIAQKPAFLYWDFNTINDIFFHTKEPVFCYGHQCPVSSGTLLQEKLLQCWFPAFTVAELGVMLPTYTESHTSGMKETWYCGKLEGGDGDFFSIEATEAEARAQYLIHLLESGLTTAEEVNQRLTQNQ